MNPVERVDIGSEPVRVTVTAENRSPRSEPRARPLAAGQLDPFGVRDELSSAVNLGRTAETLIDLRPEFHHLRQVFDPQVRRGAKSGSPGIPSGRPENRNVTDLPIADLASSFTSTGFCPGSSPNSDRLPLIGTTAKRVRRVVRVLTSAATSPSRSGQLPGWLQVPSSARVSVNAVRSGVPLLDPLDRVRPVERLQPLSDSAGPASGSRRPNGPRPRFRTGAKTRRPAPGPAGGR